MIHYKYTSTTSLLSYAKAPDDVSKNEKTLLACNLMGLVWLCFYLPACSDSKLTKFKKNKT